MSPSRRLILCSLVVIGLWTVALLSTVVFGRALPLGVLLLLAAPTFALCAYAQVVVERVAPVAEVNPNVAAGPRGLLRSSLHAAQAFCVLNFIYVVSYIMHSQCGSTLDPNTWCSVSLHQEGDHFLRRINTAEPTPVSSAMYQAAYAAIESAIAGLFMLFSLMAAWTGIYGLDYERSLGANPRLERP